MVAAALGVGTAAAVGAPLVLAAAGSSAWLQAVPPPLGKPQ